MREYAIGTDQDLRSALTPENIRKLAARGIERKFERGDCLFHQGDCGGSVFLLLDGRVKVCLIGPSGQKTILRIHLPGSLVGLSALVALPVRDATATALETVTIVELTRAEMQAVLLDDSALGLRVMRMLLSPICIRVLRTCRRRASINGWRGYCWHSASATRSRRRPRRSRSPTRSFPTWSARGARP
jgi:hypothetical protein